MTLYGIIMLNLLTHSVATNSSGSHHRVINVTFADLTRRATQQSTPRWWVKQHVSCPHTLWLHNSEAYQ